MTDGVNVDFGLLGRAPDYAADYTNAFRAGRATAGEPAVGNAFAPEPPAAVAGMLGVAGLDDAARARAAEQMELVSAVSAGLKIRAYTERRALLDHMTPALSARGVPPEVIGGFDPTDENLDSTIADAQALGDKLAGASA